MTLIVNTENNKTNTAVATLAASEIADNLRVGKITKAELTALYDDAIPVEGAVVYWEFPKAKLDESVPEGWENGEGKTFREYTMHWENDTNCLIQCGWRNGNSNRATAVSNDEFRTWVAAYGTADMLTKSAGKAKIEADYLGE